MGEPSRWERPAGFDRYWDEVDAGLAAVAAAPELAPLPLHSTDDFTTYGLRLTSLDRCRIFGWFSVPRGDGPFPGLLLTPRYGSVNQVPHHDDRLRYAVLQVAHRGQHRADATFRATYPGLLTLGIGSPATYVYRGIAADCLRAAEFLLGRAELDPKRVAVAGDDLALITAARRPGFSAVQVTGLLFHRLMEVRTNTTTYPVEEVNDHLRARPADRDAVGRTLALFDPVHHAPAVRGETLLAVDTGRAPGGAAWLDRLTVALGGPVERYGPTHEGGTDGDRLDAWLAGRLGVRPMSRFRTDVTAAHAGGGPTVPPSLPTG